MGLRIDPSVFPKAVFDEVVKGSGETRTLVLGGGSFWCTDALYRMLVGVVSVRPGYAGGGKADANYKSVCSGKTRHVQVVEIVYEPAKLTLGQILQVFFSIAHDPTVRERQGPDVGPQYRSVIFYTTPAQRSTALSYIESLQQQGVFNSLIVTDVSPLASFFEAEETHHDYVAKNPARQYVRLVVGPKISKLKKLHAGLLKPLMASP
jgi:peptide-methionine (S)-S-oxide reductase